MESIIGTLSVGNVHTGNFDHRIKFIWYSWGLLDSHTHPHEHAHIDARKHFVSIPFWPEAGCLSHCFNKITACLAGISERPLGLKHYIYIYETFVVVVHLYIHTNIYNEAMGTARLDFAWLDLT